MDKYGNCKNGFLIINYIFVNTVIVRKPYKLNTEKRQVQRKCTISSTKNFSSLVEINVLKMINGFAVIDRRMETRKLMSDNAKN